MSEIHPTAFVDPTAELGANVEVGAFSYIGPDVRVGDGCILAPRVTLLGKSTFGPNNTFHSGCILGAEPQDLKYKGGPTSLAVGAGNVFREQVTVHRGTEVDRQSGGITRIGNHNLLMVGVHIAHDAELANNIIIANAVQLAGHVCIEDGVVIGGLSAMHHFVTIGRYAYVAGMTRVTHDVPPFVKVLGYDQQVRGVNIEGLRRWQIPTESITKLKAAARILYARRGERSPLRTADALRTIKADGLLDDEHVRYLVDFLRRKLEIGIFGRAREHYRTDRDQDREKFYNPEKEVSSGE